MKKLKQQIINAVSTSLASLAYPEKEFSLAPPKNPEFGDLSTNISLLLTRNLKRPPLEIAQSIAKELKKELPHHISEITVTPPGFINFKVDKSFYQSKVKTILDEDESFGKSDLGAGRTANVEFVSANPTGPLTVGHGRNAVLGDTFSNMLE